MKTVEELQELLQNELNGMIPNLPGDLLERALNNPNYAIAFMAKQEALIEEMKQKLAEKSKPLEKTQEKANDLNQSFTLAVNIAMRLNLIRVITQILEQHKLNNEGSERHKAIVPKLIDPDADFKDDRISEGLKGKFTEQLEDVVKFDLKEEVLETAIQQQTELLVKTLEKDYPSQQIELVEAANNVSKPENNSPEAEPKKRELPAAFSTRPSLRPNPFGDS